MTLNYQKPRSKRGWRPGYCRVSLKTIRKKKSYMGNVASSSKNYTNNVTNGSKKYSNLSKVKSDVYDHNRKLFNARKAGYTSSNNERINNIIAEGEKKFSKYGYVYDGNRFLLDKTKVTKDKKQEVFNTQMDKPREAIVFFDSEEVE